jgi:energy-coupling factor transport system ATP-binding protein
MTVIETRNLTHLYGKGTPLEVAAIKDINIEIDSGELVGIIGHTGSGKSTFIQHLNGILKPEKGTVLLEGQDIWESKASIRQARFKVGLCFQYPEYQLFEETVYKDIAFGPGNMKLDEDEIDR